jgi:ligand-binding sensor domain-containing protein
LTTPEKRPGERGSGLELEDPLPAYPILRKNSDQIVDRANGIWFVSSKDPLLRHPAGEPLAEIVRKASPGNSQAYDFDPYRYARVVDRDGSVWFGEARGVHRFSYSSLVQLQLPHTHGHWFTLAPDDGGKVWISSGGATGLSTLYRVADGKVEFEKPQHGVANFAYRAPDQTFWFAGEGGLWHMVSGRLTRIELPPALVHGDQYLQAIAQDRLGGMWVSFWNRGLYRLDHGTWTQYGGRRDLSMLRVYAEFTDSLGRIWFGSRNNVLAMLQGDRVQTFGPGDGIRVGEVTAIYARGPEIWIGGELGLQQFDQGRFHSINAVNPECVRGISGILQTANGDLWLNGLRGIFHIRRTEITEALKNSAYRVSGERFGRREGLPGLAPQVRPLPTAIEGTDGRLWFTVNNGVVWLDPARASNKIPPPPVTIQSVSADDKGYRLDQPLKFPARTSSVQISYSAVSLSDPEAIRFLYKLREIDAGWHDAEASTSVSYRNLAPGSYHFVVTASDPNGLWSDNAATV